MGFRYKRGIRVPPRERTRLRRLCRQVGGEHHEALWDFVTTSKPWQQICMDHYISASTLFRCVRKFYKIKEEK